MSHTPTHSFAAQRHALAARGAAALGQAGVVYVAAISAMPSMITKMFALPALREVPVPIGLAREAALLADVPRQKGVATMLKLRQLTVEHIGFAADAGALNAALNP